MLSLPRELTVSMFKYCCFALCPVVSCCFVASRCRVGLCHVALLRCVVVSCCHVALCCGVSCCFVMLSCRVVMLLCRVVLCVVS